MKTQSPNWKASTQNRFYNSCWLFTGVQEEGGSFLVDVKVGLNERVLFASIVMKRSNSIKLVDERGGGGEETGDAFEN